MPAAAYLLATGAEPDHSELPGLDRVDYLTATTAMEQTVLPTSLLVIGRAGRQLRQHRGQHGHDGRGDSGHPADRD